MKLKTICNEYDIISNSDDVNILNSYMKDIGKKKRYTKEEINVLAEKFIKKEEGAKKIQFRKELIYSQLRFVVKTARPYFYNHPHLTMDIINEGNVGLMIAVDKYDPSKGALTTYSKWWIKHKIIRYLLKKKNSIYLPMGITEKQYGFEKTYQELNDKQRSIDGKEIKKEDIKHFSEKDIKKFEYLSKLKVVQSLDETIGETLQLKDIIGMSEDYLKKFQNEQLRSDLFIYLEKLKPSTRFAIKQKNGFNEEGKSLSLKKIGKKMNITPEGVRQKILKGYKKIRELALNNGLKTYLD